MLIAYVNYIILDLDNLSGVVKKITYQAKAAEKLNLPIDFIILNPSISKQEKNLNFIKINERIYVKKLCKYSLIEKYVNLDNYDYIVLRYVGIDFSAMRFIRKYGKKVITEHHTDEIKEFKTLSRNSRGWFKLRLKFKSFLEERVSPYFLSRVRGIIAVTEEIAKIELKKANRNIPFSVVPNGIDVDNVPFTKFKKFDGKTLNIIFVASQFSPWHGLDILLKSFENYRGSLAIRLFLIGYLDNSLKKKALKYSNARINVEILGKKFGKDLDYYFRNSNIAVSTLALYRKGLKQACALKTREYIARGIPFIYGYEDVDLKGNEDFALRVGKKLDIEEIIDFAKRVSEKDNISEEMRRFAYENLDWRIKMRKMYEFIKSL